MTMPVRYLDSRFYCEIQAKNVTVSGTNVPWYLSEAGAVADLVGLCYRSDGKDFVICDAAGNLIAFDVFYFDRANKKIGLVYRDPAQDSGTGLGTKLYAWCGGTTVVFNRNNPETYSGWNAGDHLLVDHSEQEDMLLPKTDSTQRFSGIHRSYATGAIKKATNFVNSNGSGYERWSIINTVEHGYLVNSINSFTLSFFINQTVSGSNAIIFGYGIRYTPLKIRIDTTSENKLTIQILGSLITLLNYSTHFPSGTATLFTIVYDGSGSTNQDKVKLYANTTLLTLGFELNSVPASISGAACETTFAGYFQILSGGFVGTLDEKKWLLAALSAAQITNQYNNMAGFDTNATVEVGNVEQGVWVDCRVRVRCNSEVNSVPSGIVACSVHIRCDAVANVYALADVDARVRIACSASSNVTIGIAVDAIFQLRVAAYTGKRYQVKIKSKPLYAGPNHESFGEILTAIFNCEFREKIPLNILLYSDYQRYVSEGIYGDNEKIINNQLSVGQPYFRHSITIAPKAGFVGSFFQYEIEKTLASDGFFKFFGADIKYIPKPTLNAEFLSKLGTINNGWE